MITKLLFFVFILPVYIFSLDPNQIQSNIISYASQFQSFKADFIMEIKNKNGKVFQRGSFSYEADGRSIYQLDNPGPMAIKIDQNGIISIPKDKIDFYDGIKELNLLFKVLYTMNFEFILSNETSSNATLMGLEPNPDKEITGEKKLLINYNKNNNIIDFIRYTGDDNTTAFESEIDYTNILDIPVIQSITTTISNGIIKIYLENIEFKVK